MTYLILIRRGIYVNDLRPCNTVYVCRILSHGDIPVCDTHENIGFQERSYSIPRIGESGSIRLDKALFK
jgi:hypothetical protein